MLVSDCKADGVEKAGTVMQILIPAAAGGMTLSKAAIGMISTYIFTDAYEPKIAAAPFAGEDGAWPSGAG